MIAVNKCSQRIKSIVGAVILAVSLSAEPFTTAAATQEVKPKWEKTFEKSVYSVSGLFEASDADYLFKARYTSSPNDKDVVMKVNGSGKLKWEKVLDNGFPLKQIHETKEGDYLLFRESDKQSRSYRLTKLDDAGKNIEEIDVHATDHIYLNDVAQAKDGGYYLVGYKYAGCCTKDGYDDNYEAHVIKTNDKGEFEWEKTLEGDYREQALEVKGAKDGGIFILGNTQKNVNMANMNNIYAAKLSSDGALEWAITYDAPKRTKANYVASTNDGGYVITGAYGYTDYADWQDILVLKIDKDGKEEWHKIYNIDRIDISHSVKQTEDGGYVVLASIGYSNEGEGDPKACILYLDSSGEIRSHVLLTPDQSQGIVTNDNAYIFVGKDDSSFRLVKYIDKD